MAMIPENNDPIDAPAPQTPAQPADLAELRDARERLRLSYHPPSDSESAMFSWLCKAIGVAERLSTAHETLQVAHDQLRAERDSLIRGMKLLVETSAHLSCGHDGCYGESVVNDDGTWEFLHCWQCRAEKAEAELTSLRSSRETEERQAIRFVLEHHGIYSGEVLDRAVEQGFTAYQQRQPQEDGQS